MSTNIVNSLKESLRDGAKEHISTIIGSIFKEIPGPIISLCVDVTLRWSIAKVCKELVDRNITKNQTDKINVFLKEAFATYMELCDKGFPEDSTYIIDDAYFKQNSFEAAEHIFTIVANESQNKKLSIIGRFYGNELYHNPREFEEIFSLTNLASNLSYRQIIMIKLIVDFLPFRNEERKDVKCLEFTNTSTTIEFQNLLIYGMFEVGQGSVGWSTYDFSNYSFSDDIYKTKTATLFYEKFSLDKVSEHEVLAIIKTF